MLSVEEFSHDVCERLLQKGYTHFVIKNKVEKKHFRHITFEAVRDADDVPAIPIRQVIYLPTDAITRFYVMYAG